MNDILQADVLDIIFDGRNKQYGAYQLRKSYNRRLVIAMAAMLFICLLVMAGSVLAKNVNSKKAQVITVEDYNLTAVDVVPPLPPPPPPPRPQPRVETIKFTPPKIVSTPVTDIPPPVDKLDNVTISDVTEKGEKTDAVNPPPEPKGTGAKEIRVSETPPGTIMVQVLAAFPGGAKAWKKYLERNLRQDVPVENGAPAGDYKVVVSFIVNADGTLSNIKAENDPGYGVAGEAVRVVQKSGKWVPAIQNGRYVTYRQQQPITFRVTVEQQ